MDEELQNLTAEQILVRLSDQVEHLEDDVNRLLNLLKSRTKDFEGVFEAKMDLRETISATQGLLPRLQGVQFAVTTEKLNRAAELSGVTELYELALRKEAHLMEQVEEKEKVTDPAQLLNALHQILQLKLQINGQKTQQILCHGQVLVIEFQMRMQAMANQ